MSKNFLVEINADVFVIPNHAGKINEFFWFDKIGKEDYADNYFNWYKNLYKANNKEYNQDEFLVQIWLTGEISENIIRHGFRMTIDNKRYYTDSATLSSLEYCPRCLINIKEGETCDLLVKDVEVYERGFDVDDGKEHTRKVDILFHLTANQSDYRYRGFSTFEDVVEKVCY